MTKTEYSPIPGAAARPLRSGAAAVHSRGIAKIPHLSAFIGVSETIFRPSDAMSDLLSCVVGWGRKKTANRAIAFAHRHALPYIALEDGFLRSLGLGVTGAQPLSLVLDDVGIYYDATRPSRLELMLESPDMDNPATLAEARRAMDLILQNNLSKYNHAPDLSEGALQRVKSGRVLVVDQTAEDLSVTLGLANAESFRVMLAAAVAENPDSEICVKLHPDTISGRKAGYLAAIDLPPGIRLVSEDVNPLSLLGACDRVYTVSSLFGFEALMLGLPVTCFGVPFYSGWGVTDDRITVARRRRRRSVVEIFAAAYMRYARYVDPVTGDPSDIFRTIGRLSLARRINEENRGTIFCFGTGTRRWKRPHLRAFLGGTGTRLDFVNSVRSVRHRRIGPGSRVAVWGDRYPSELAALVLETGAPLVRIEDGFIRSAGLGSDLTDPSSLVFDRSGIYYDPANESDLERILRTTRFSRTLIDRASRLRNEILALGISKYNFEGGHNPAPEPPKGRRSILVPGQVEDDASVRLGSPVVRSNLELLRAVRDAAPEAWILYKPHPDVLAGNRRGTVGGPELLELCDAVTKNATISACLSAVGEVHTMTSLVGFEALLRSKTVVAYGAPFYAGWGLTKDHVDMRRRDRRLTIDELVAGVLILYPRYYDWNSGLFCECEDVVRLLADKRVATIEPGIVSTIGRQFLRLSRWLGAWRHV